MKRRVPVIIFLLAIISFAGSPPDFATSKEENVPLTEFQIKNLATFCKVWGFLKYYHPYPSEKNVDWDNVLVENYDKILGAATKDEFNSIIHDLSEKAGSLKPRKNKFFPADSQAVNVDFSWIYDTVILSPDNSNFLISVRKNHRGFKNKYVSSYFMVGNAKFHEEAYPDMIYPTDAYRYLSLARYWNAIEYYFPYKYLTDHPWKQSLQEAIPIFFNAKSKEEYYRAIKWITARINDGHATYVTCPYWKQAKTKKLPPFTTIYHNDTLTVAVLLSDSIAALNDIYIGDQIIQIDNKPISLLWQDVIDHHSFSNSASAEYHLGRGAEMLWTHNDSSSYTIIRNNKPMTLAIRNYYVKEYVRRWTERNSIKTPTTNILFDSISGYRYGYIDMGTVKKKQVDSFFEELTVSPFLIIDCRKYPTDFYAVPKIADHIVHKKQRVARFTYPNYSYPGYIKYGPAGLRFGTNSNNYYKGQVIILVDHNTMSAAEYMTMAFQAAPNSVVIGNQTAGADGNVSDLFLPGNYQTFFSGLGWYYADGRQTQRIGIIPDIKVEYTVESELAQRDPIMEKALELIRTKK